jgi:hypothetical protein
VYVVGQTSSTNFPGTTGGAQAVKASGGGYDAFIARLNSSLTTLTQATYLGGSGDDAGGALAIHPTSGDVFVDGTTTSTDFPGTTGGAQATNGGGQDAFVARLNAALTTLKQATYLGGSGADWGVALAIHPTSGDVYVSGFTLSTDFPGTTGGAQAANGGGFDAYVARFTPNLASAPEPTPGKVTGGGQIAGDPVFSATGTLLSAPALIASAAGLNSQATFGFSMTCCAPAGNLEYNDHSVDVRIKAQSITGLFISSPGASCPSTAGSHHAKFTGMAFVIRSTATTTESFTVDVDDCGQPGTNDTFGIKTTTYSNGPSTLIGGNIHIDK